MSNEWTKLNLTQNKLYGPIEVKKINDEIYFRTNNDIKYTHIPKQFQTQLGLFRNHNNGEFESWIELKNYTEPDEKMRLVHETIGRNNQFLEGNFCDVFDCGKYVIAIDNQMHFGIGRLKIIKIDKELNCEILYHNEYFSNWVSLEYLGKCETDSGYNIVASGHEDTGEKQFKKITILFKITKDGELTKTHTWNYRINSYNLVAKNECIYFGHNGIITKVNTNTGERTYFTNRTKGEE